MCIVLDVNIFSETFDVNNPSHNEFKPVYDWIYFGKGKVIVGGTKYFSELKFRYLNIIGELKKINKVVLVDNQIVDFETDKVSKLLTHKDFDDPHLVALLRASGCKLICSNDSRGYKFFTHSLFFKPASKKPKIYSSISHKKLLCDVNIAEICKPCMKTKKIKSNKKGYR